MLATILLTFNSWRLTGIAFGVTGCSFGLSLLALAVFQYPLGIQALIGVIGSVGVSINAAIIILSGLKLNEQASLGDPDAIVDVVMDASRHIVSTTVTTFGGFLPLILEGSQFWPPFAMAIAGGVLLSTIVSFYLVPPLYTLLMHPRAAISLSPNLKQGLNRPSRSGRPRESGTLQLSPRRPAQCADCCRSGTDRAQWHIGLFHGGSGSARRGQRCCTLPALCR
jgi:uncharacterized membrane protein YdfJ with MMPL/SSD domain